MAAAALAASLLSPMAAAAESSATVTLSGNATWTTSRGTPTTAGGYDIGLWSATAVATKTITTSYYENRILLTGRASVCEGNAIVNVYVDSTLVGQASFSNATAYQQVKVGAGIGAGTHRVKLTLANDYQTASCDRNAYISDIGTEAIKPDGSNTGAATSGLKTVGPGKSVYATSGALVGTISSSSNPASNGRLNISASNVTVSGYDIAGIVNVTGSNVTITNSRIRGYDLGSTSSGVGNLALYTSQGSNNQITYSTLRPDAYWTNANGSKTVDARWIGLAGGGFTADHVNVSGSVDLIQTTGSNIAVSASYLHDSTQYAPAADPWLVKTGTYSSNPSHSDGWQIQSGGNLRAAGNTFTGTQWTALVATQDLGRLDGLTIDRNWIGGGKCSVMLTAKSGATQYQRNVTVTNNIFTGVNPTIYPAYPSNPGCYILSDFQQTNKTAPNGHPTLKVSGNSTTENGYDPNVVWSGNKLIAAN